MNILSALRPVSASALASGGDGRLRILLPPDARTRVIELSQDEDTWDPVLIVDPSEDWRVIAIDLTGLARRVYVRVSGG